MSFVNNLYKTLQVNVREYGMFIALFVIMAYFTIQTDGVFLSSKNISNLLNQTGYLAVLAVGMTLVIVIRHIDLSVGFLSGFIGAVTGVVLAVWGYPVYVAIPMALLLGMVAGSITGFMVAKLGISGFVASLAGFMAYRGAILLTLKNTGTIIIEDETFVAIGNGFIPDLDYYLQFLPDSITGLFSPGFFTDSFLPGYHKFTVILGLLAIALYIFNEIKMRKVKQSYSFEVVSLDMFILKILFISSLIGYFVMMMASENGISWTVLIVVFVVALYHFITTKTVLGRHIYALGGNPEAAELSGINVKKITFIVFVSMGMLSALSGILYASRLQCSTLTAGTLFELNAIAATFVGGTSTAGGIGKVTGSIIGALIMISLINGMGLMGTDISYQYIVLGVVLAVAVIFDVATRKRGK